MDPVEIAAGAFQLQPWQPHDALEVFQACQDDDIQRYTTVPSPYSMADAEFFVGTLSPRGWENGTSASFAVKDATSGRLLASVGFPSVNTRLRKAELGYWCAPWARGRGVTLAGVRAICGWAFDADHVDYIGWRARVGNEASRAVAEKVGFTIEGVMRSESLERDGTRGDSWYGSLLRGELTR